MKKVCPKCKTNKYLDYDDINVTACVGCGKLYYDKQLLKVK